MEKIGDEVTISDKSDKEVAKEISKLLFSLLPCTRLDELINEGTNAILTNPKYYAIRKALVEQAVSDIVVKLWIKQLSQRDD